MTFIKGPIIIKAREKMEEKHPFSPAENITFNISLLCDSLKPFLIEIVKQCFVYRFIIITQVICGVQGSK